MASRRPAASAVHTPRFDRSLLLVRHWCDQLGGRYDELLARVREAPEQGAPGQSLRLAAVLSRAGVALAPDALARAGDRETLVIQQRTDLTDHQHVMTLIVAPVAAPLDRLEVGKLLLPVAQHMRFHAAQLADLPNGEIALGRDDR